MTNFAIGFATCLAALAALGAVRVELTWQNGKFPSLKFWKRK